jgi:hypothetical protein
MSQSSPAVSTNTSDSPPEWYQAGGIGSPIPAWERTYPWWGADRIQAVIVLLLGFIALAPGVFCVLAIISKGGLGQSMIGSATSWAGAIFLLIVLIIFTLVFGPGIYVLYLGTCALVNSITFRLDRGWLQVYTGPLPQSHTLSLRAVKICRINITKQVEEDFTDYDGIGYNGCTYYRLEAGIMDGKSVVLLDKYLQSSPLVKIKIDLCQALGL